MDSSATLLIIFSVVVVCGVKVFADFRSAVKSLQNLPGTRTIFPSFGLIGLLFPNPVPILARGNYRSWKRKHSEYAECGLDIISAIALLPQVTRHLFVADPAAIKEVTSNRARFPKPTKPYRVLSFFGENIVGSEGDEWKRFRKIVSPSFSERNNRLVWDETVKILSDLIENVWGEREAISVENSTDITVPIALFIISVAGFGKRIGWRDEASSSSNYTMSFKNALHIVSGGIFVKAVTPSWLLNLAPTDRLREVKTAYEDMNRYMIEMVEERRNSDKKGKRYDLFSSLLDANEGESDNYAKLTDRELRGNIFIFLLAGHETTAHTLAFTLGLLALYPDYQDTLHKQIKRVLGTSSIPMYEMMNSFTESVAVFYETLRLFPPVINIPKRSSEDTTLVTSDADGNAIVVPVSRGTGIVLDVAGLHYNPKYWDDPHAFRPERFRGDWPRDAFLPFSGGARSCLGRRFSETEAIAILAMLISRYKVEVKEEAQFAGETFAERKERILRAKRGVTLTPVRMPLIFRRR